MKIPGWAYVAVGTFVSLFSGYIYKFVPKPDGTPNMSMAVFFFAGIIFIIVGFIRIFFKKIDYELDTKFEKDSEEISKKLQQPIRHQTIRHNKVEEQINNEYQKQHTSHHQHSHTSQYARNHPYHNQSSDTGQNTPRHTSVQQMTISVCNRCGLKNPVSSNYCHGCGNRLR